MKSLTYFSRRPLAFSINEGGGPVNLHVNLRRGARHPFIDIYFFGRTFTKQF